MEIVKTSFTQYIYLAMISLYMEIEVSQRNPTIQVNTAILKNIKNQFLTVLL